MDFVARHRISILGAAALLCLAGIVALLRLPVQLMPDIEEPVITIWTPWPGAAAAEVERAITEPQESVMRGLDGLAGAQATANAGVSSIQLRFVPGTNLDPVFVEVIGRLQRVPALPRGAQPPVVRRGDDGPERTLIYFFVQLLPGAEGPVERHQAMVQRVVLPRLERIPGVASARIKSGPDTELRVEVDPGRAAALGIELPALVRTLSALDDVSAGAVELGRTNYALRLHGRFDPEALDALPVGRIGGRTVTLGEIGTADFVRPDRVGFSYQNGNPALTLQLFREPGTNVLDTLDALDAEVELLRAEVLGAAGLDMQKSFEPGIFIRRAIGFLSGNLGVGLLAALACLWLFLRNTRVTVLIAVAVPVSLLATTLVLGLLGRSLNMISIAGLAFAVGMVMDAAIVVVESALARRAAGLDIAAAAREGAARVSGALFAATVTTVAVFLPVLALEDVAGQVFADLALTIAIAVVASLGVALWVVPALLPLLLVRPCPAQLAVAWPTLAAHLARVSATPRRALALSALLVAAPLLLAPLLAPPRDYLPPVKRAAVDAFLQMPPGMGAERIEAEIARPIIERLRPYMEGTAEPRLLNYYILTWPGGGREIWIHLRGAEVAELRQAGAAAETLLREALPGAQVRMIPGAAAEAAEIAVLPDHERLAERGLSRAWLADALRVLGDGRYLGDYFDGERRVPTKNQRPARTTGEASMYVPVPPPAVPPAGGATFGRMVCEGADGQHCRFFH